LLPRLLRETSRAATGARTTIRLARVAEYPFQFEGRCNFELVVAAILRALIGAPAEELSGMAESRSLHVVVGDLADSLGPQRLPAQILAAVPPARRAGKALPDLFLRHGPVAPGMLLQGVLSQRRELFDEFLPRLGRERDGHADVMKRSVLVVQPEQQRADHRSRAVLVPPEPRDDAVGRAPVLDLDHRPLARFVGLVEPLGHDPIQTGALEPAEPVLRERAVLRRRREMERRPDAGELPLEALTPRRQRNAAKVLAADRQEVPGDVRRRRLSREQLHA